MELRHIRYFLAVVDEGGFTRAAHSVGIGQPPLSQQIKALEAEVGTALFHRLPHGAALTPAGEAFLAVVRPMPGMAAEAARAAQRAARGESGSLALGFTGLAALNPLTPAAIRRFQHAYPQVELRLEEASSLVLIEGLAEGRLDAALIRPPRQEPAEVRIFRLLEEPLIAALPASHPATGLGEPLDLAALRDLPLIAVGGGLQDEGVAACRQAGFEPAVGPRAPQIASILSLVAAGLGFALVPVSTRQLAVAGVVFCSLVPTRTIGLALAQRRDARSTVLRNFGAVLRAEAERRRAS